MPEPPYDDRFLDENSPPWPDLDDRPDGVPPSPALGRSVTDGAFESGQPAAGVAGSAEDNGEAIEAEPRHRGFDREEHTRQ